MTPRGGSDRSLNDPTTVRNSRGTVTIRDRDAVVRHPRSAETWAPYADELPADLALPLVARRSNVVFVAYAE